MTDEPENAWFSDNTATFGDRLAAARDQAALSQGDLAKRLGVKLSTLRAWEDDRSEPRANKLQMVSGVLGVSMGWLMTGEGDGVDAPDAGALPPADGLEALLLELRQVRADITKSNERLALLEKTIRQRMKGE
jgi:transcriptional regulator with XRE-family HTH domain